MRLAATGAWEYAPAPESRDILTFADRYGLFIGGELVDPRSRDVVHDRLAGHRGAAGRGRAGRREGRRARRRRGTRGVRGVESRWRPAGAGEAALPDRADPAGARARAGGRRVARRRQADQGVTRRRPSARCRALLLLRRLGRQARVRVPGTKAAAARRGGADRSLELPAADAGLEDRAGARLWQHRRAQAGRDDAADRAPLRRRLPPGAGAAGRRQHRHRRRLDRRAARSA